MGKRICIYENDVDKAWYDSSTVLYSECDDKEGSLKSVKVVFKNGGTYLYKDVKVNDYLLFREGSSQGKSLHKVLKQYEFEKLPNTDVNLLMEEYNNVLKRLEESRKETVKTYVISAFPGCGKTTAYNYLKNKFKVLDSDSSQFDKNEFPENYLQHIQDNIGVVDIIFVSSHENVRKGLSDLNIDYYLFYPNIDRKSEMLSLYDARGNNVSFIDLMNRNFNHFIESVASDSAANKICLENEGDFIMNNNTFNNILKEIQKRYE
jgi:hypothetical protein